MSCLFLGGRRRSGGFAYPFYIPLGEMTPKGLIFIPSPKGQMPLVEWRGNVLPGFEGSLESRK